MYIPGLDLSLSSRQWLKVPVVLSTADYFRFTLVKVSKLAAISESNAGRVRPETLQTTFLGRTILTPIYGLAMFVPPLTYIGAVVLDRFRQPEWMARFALSDEMMGPTWTGLSRALACVASFVLRTFTNSGFEHLGDQWHLIGRRETSRVVKTGPYAWIRHPGYCAVLVQEALWTVMFWSYIPLVALGTTALAFAIKMPIEEGVILRDDAVRDEYRQYMKGVPARTVPYVG